MIDIFLTFEKKRRSKLVLLKHVMEESVIVLKPYCCEVKSGPSLKLHRHYVRVKPALHGISVITPKP